jgi:hypothetical protein
MSTLHVHVDESGDLDFSPSGSKFIVFSALWTYDPLPLAWDLQTLRFVFLKASSSAKYLKYRLERLERFHCCDDSYDVRELVIKRMVMRPGWKFAAIVVQKNKVPPKEREHIGSFYARFATMPLRLLLRGPISDRATRVLIYTDRFPSQCKRDLTEKAIKKACRAELPERLPFSVFHHASSSNTWLQAADYCAHAVARKWERTDGRLYELLKSRLAREELNVLGRATSTYY